MCYLESPVTILPESRPMSCGNTSAVSSIELSSVRFSPFSENLPQSYSASPTQVTYFIAIIYAFQATFDQPFERYCIWRLCLHEKLLHFGLSVTIKFCQDWYHSSSLNCEVFKNILSSFLSSARTRGYAKC